VDAALSDARHAALEGDLERAAELLEALLTEHPNDPLIPVARLLLARVTLARGDAHTAERLARATESITEPGVVRTRRLVLGVAAARARASGDALTWLRPLEGRLPDRAETAELSCALAESEARAGDGVRALRALAVVETLATEGTAWLPTGLSCEQPESRLQLVAQVLSRTEAPDALADTLDHLPVDSPLRRPIAVRLRTLAEQTQQLSRWLRWLADLPDNSAVAGPATTATRPSARLVVGLLAPLTGPRSAVGVALLRGVQYGLEPLAGTRVVPEDEGDSPEAVAAAVDRLVAHGVRAIVGPSREDLAAAAAARAQSLGVDLWLIAPGDAEERGERVHLAAPALDARARALAAALPERSAGVTLLAAEGADALQSRIERLLPGATVASANDDARRGGNGGRNVRVVLGAFGRESRTAFARGAERAATRWLFDARAPMPGSAGLWVGVRPGPAHATLLTTWCTQVGEAPDELALLAHDAARAAVAHLRQERALPSALAPDFALASGLAPSGPAAAARCP
jgi:hypothetical protein